MAPTKKEKTKTDLKEAMFKFSDKKEELEELLGDPPDEHGVPNSGLVNSILLELSDKWETVRSSFMNFVKTRDVEEDRTEVEEWTTKYKQWRKSFVEVRRRVAKAHSSMGIPERVHPLLKPLFSQKCPPSHPTLQPSMPNSLNQPEVLASCDASNLQPSPATDTTAKCVAAKRNHGYSLPEKAFMVDIGVVDHAGQIKTALQAAAFTGLKLEDEVCMVGESVARLPSELSSETVSDHLPEEAFMMDMELLPETLALPNKTARDDLKVEIIATFAGVALSTATSCPTNSHVPYSVMQSWLTVTAVAKFSVKWSETLTPVNRVKLLGEPPPWNEYL